MNITSDKVVFKDNCEYWYDVNGKKIHFNYSNEDEECWEYDSIGRIIHYKDFDGYEYWNEYDVNGNKIHVKDSYGYEEWREYDANGNQIHYKNSYGFEVWYNSDGKLISKKEFDAIHSSCHGKVIEVDGKKYQLTAI